MKLQNVLWTIILLLLVTNSIAQINYQAALRDDNNQPIVHQAVNVDVEILQAENKVYTESHFTDSGILGVLNIIVGTGANASSNFSDIDWSKESYTVRLTVDGEQLPATPINAVPIAEYAKNANDGLWERDDATSNILYSAGKVTIGSDTTGNYTFNVFGTPSFGIPGKGNALLNFNSERPWQFRQYAEGSAAALELVSIGGGGNKHFLINTTGKVGINTQHPYYTLHVNGGASFGLGGNSENGSILLKLDSERAWAFRQFSSDAAAALELANIGGGGNKDFLITTTGNVGIGTTAPQQKLDVNGRTRTKSLEITGGSDIVEGFNSKDVLEPGDVVVIDEDNPSNICKTHKAYNQKVAGVVSGANGVQPGLSLSQQNVLEGAYPIAMIGRVYVKVTGKVKVGDRLTTSNTPGYAMASKKRRKANGAVLGKALSNQNEDKGYVLVLINLQ